MSRARRRPCPYCDAPIRLDAATCTYCRTDVTVLVRLEQPVLDSYTRDQVARALIKALRPNVSLSELIDRLTSGRALLRDLSRFDADVAVNVLQEHGVGGQVDMASGPPSSQVVRSVHDPWARQQRRRRRIGCILWALGTIVFGGILFGAIITTYVLFPDLFKEPIAPVVTANPSAATPAPKTAQEASVERVAEGSLPSIVSIRCAGGVGSGFFVSATRILTNRHVVKYDAEIAIKLASGKEAKAKILRSTEAFDAALLEVVGDSVRGRPLQLSSSQTLSVGQRVVVIGSPMGLDFTVHEGTISNLDREIGGTRFFQLDARINPGNSGGPVLDLDGRVVGMVTLKARQAEGIGLAIPIELSRRELEPF